MVSKSSPPLLATFFEDLVHSTPSNYSLECYLKSRGGYEYLRIWIQQRLLWQSPAPHLGQPEGRSGCLSEKMSGPTPGPGGADPHLLCCTPWRLHIRTPLCWRPPPTSRTLCSAGAMPDAALQWQGIHYSAPAIRGPYPCFQSYNATPPPLPRQFLCLCLTLPSKR
jgi:hypothetical protein